MCRLLVIGVGLSGIVRAQETGSVRLDTSEQIFCVLAALNLAGYDTGLGQGPASAVRQLVRSRLREKNPAVAAELRKFYSARLGAGDASANLGHYLSLALLLGPPPDFRPVVPLTDFPPDAKVVAGLVPLLKTFYQEANIGALWAELQKQYEAEMERYSEAVRAAIARADAYLRFASGAYLGRTYTIYLDLLSAPEQVHARIYGQNYYLVVTPSRGLKLNEIRHQYLHFLLDPLAVKYAPEINLKAELKAVVRSAPGLARDFKEDFPLFVTECLIRATELRMDKPPKAEAERILQELVSSGLVLTPYFHSSLTAYEKQDGSMNIFYKQMILGVDVGQEKARLASVKFATPVTVKEAPPAQSEEERLLDEGDNLIYEGRYKEARSLFQSVLESRNPQSERALFGLAVVASNTRKPDLAEDYFRKTLEAARDARIATWAHIYLGRLYDLKGERDKAVSEYRAASLTAAAFPDAARAAENGLRRPFGAGE